MIRNKYHVLAVGASVLFTLWGILLGYNFTDVVLVLILFFMMSTSQSTQNIHDALLELEIIDEDED